MTRSKLPRRAQRAQLEQAELLGPGLIHEMRHPLVGIKAGLELIARRLGTQVTDLDDWQMVSTQVVRLEELFRSYQQLFAPEPAAQSPFAVESVVQRAVDLVAWRVRRLGPRFEWVRDGSRRAFGSPTALLHAVINLIVNAVDAVEEVGGARRVAVRVLPKPLQVRISDEGSGIAPEAKRVGRDRIRFRRLGQPTEAQRTQAKPSMLPPVWFMMWAVYWLPSHRAPRSRKLLLLAGYPVIR